MLANTLPIIFTTLLALASLAFGVWGVEDKLLSVFPFLRGVAPHLPAITAAITVLTIVSALLSVVIYVSGGVKSWNIGNKKKKALANTTVITAQPQHLETIAKIASTTISPVFTEDEVKQTHNHCKRAYHVVLDTLNDEVIGFFCFLPLTRTGEERVKNRTLIPSRASSNNSGATAAAGVGFLQSGCFGKKFRRGDAIYIGSVAGKDQRGSLAAYYGMIAEVKNLNATVLYTRPITEDGVRLAKGKKFVPVSDQDTIGKNVYLMKDMRDQKA